jgi:hypothetical protein
VQPVENPFPNKYPATCTACSKPVLVGAGMTEKVRGKWETTCQACLAGKAPEKASVSMKLAPDGVVIEPVGYLGGDLFAAYRRAVTGARFDPARKAQVVGVEKLPKIIDALQAAGFALAIDPAVEAEVRKLTAGMKADVVAAKARADRVDDFLRAKGKALYPYQRAGVAWLAARKNAGLFDDPGLGKTIQTLVALPDKAPVVVVCPSVAKGVWQREAAAWRPDYKVSVLSGEKSFRWSAAGEIVVLNYDILPPSVKTGKFDELAPALAASMPPGVVVVADEAHKLKSSKALRTKRFRAIAYAAMRKDGRAWLLTGTPMLNEPMELWTVLNAALLAKEAYGSFDNFVDLYAGTKLPRGGYEWGTPSPEVGPRLKRVALRRRREEVLPDLPVKTYDEIPVEITDKEALKLADEIMRRLAEQGVDLERAVKLAALTDLMGAVPFEMISKTRAALATAKIKAMEEVVEDYEEQNEPLVVFSAHRAPINLLAKRPGWVTITGDETGEEKAALAQAFQEGQYKGIALTIRAGGEAITLTRASHLLFVDLEWTPALNNQASDRICRLGQNRGCIIKTLVAEHPLEQRIYELLTEKERLIEAGVEVAARRGESVPSLPVPEIDFAKLAVEANALAKQEEERAEREAASTGKPKVSPYRPPFTELEVWAARGLRRLSLDDPDYAAQRNEVGFNANDGAIGHDLDRTLRMKGGLTEKQWVLAIKILRKYWRQIGPPPEEGEKALSLAPPEE